MIQEIRIDCINKNDRHDPTERIERVGGRNADGRWWNLLLDQAIAGAESGRWRFFVQQGGQKAYVVVAVSRSGRKYLKTEADGYEPNNLLSLPECL